MDWSQLLTFRYKVAYLFSSCPSRLVCGNNFVERSLLNIAVLIWVQYTVGAQQCCAPMPHEKTVFHSTEKRNSYSLGGSGVVRVAIAGVTLVAITSVASPVFA